jgi:hypothetical protein
MEIEGLPARAVPFDKIDDAVFDTDTATLAHGVFALDGSVEFWGYSRPLRRARHRIRLRIQRAIAFEFADPDNVGRLIAESVDETPSAVVVTSVIPGVLTVRTAGPSSAEFFITMAPAEIRRRFHWVPFVRA